MWATARAAEFFPDDDRFLPLAAHGVEVEVSRPIASDAEVYVARAVRQALAAT